MGCGQSRREREALLAKLEEDGRNLRGASAKLRADREVVVRAVGQNGTALQYASEQLRADREVVMAAVNAYGGWRALEYASVELRADREIVETAVRKDNRALQYVGADLRAKMVAAEEEKKAPPPEEPAEEAAPEDEAPDEEAPKEVVPAKKAQVEDIPEEAAPMKEAVIAGEAMAATPAEEAPAAEPAQCTSSEEGVAPAKDASAKAPTQAPTDAPAAEQVDCGGRIQYPVEPTDVNLQQNFAACDTNDDGRLCPSELRFALQALGIFPTEEQLTTVPAALQLAEVDLAGFANLQRCMRQDAAIKKDFPCVPYARRGVTLAQLQHISEAFVREGWLRERCDDYNRTRRAEIAEAEAAECSENLYALDRFLVRKATHPECYRDVPEHLRIKARLPVPSRKSSYAELANPMGLVVHYFVSHFWGHLFSRTLKSLERFAASEAAMEPAAVVFWICLFALNQHNAALEVGSSPEDGPFNAALAKATHGVVMVLDECVNPLKRIWCLYEVQRVSDFGKHLTMLGEAGPLAEDPGALMRVADAIEGVRAFDAEASEEGDKLAIFRHIMNASQRRALKSEVVFQRFFHSRGCWFWFSEFDEGVAKIFGTCLLPMALRSQNLQLAKRCLAWGACERGADAWRRVADLCGGAAALTALQVETKWADSPVPLLLVAARCGNAEAAALLCEAGASVKMATPGGATPAHFAAQGGHAEVLQLLCKAGASVEVAEKVQSRTPAHVAALAGHAEVLRLLHEAGASLEAADAESKTPAHFAALAGHAEVLRLLLRETGASLEAVDAYRATPAHLAALSGHAEVLRLLLCEAEADLEAVASNGATPADAAAEAGHAEVLRLLRGPGGRPAGAG